MLNGSFGTIDINGFSANNVSAGFYNMKIRNTDHCELLKGINISDADAPAVSDSIIPVKCFGQSNGAVYLKVDGGNSPKFEWMGDANLVESSLTKLKAGDYHVKITDGQCIAGKTYTVKEPAQLRADAVIKHIICAGEDKGSINITAVGGTIPFSYLWGSGQTTRNLSNLEPGNYSLRVTDFNECTFVQTFTVNGNPPLVINETIVTPTNDQADGSITLQLTGGVAPYTYLWGSGATGSVLFNLPNGTYSVEVTDHAGCRITKSWLLDNTSVPILATNRILIYPNPVQSQLFVKIEEWNGSSAQEFEAEIFNLMGGKVLSHKFSGEEYSALQTSGLQSGLYILRITSGGQMWQSRFVKR
jgi:hypothetical protein